VASTFVSNWFENVPGMRQIHEINAAYHPNVQVRPLHYTQGVVHAKVWVEVLKRAGALDRASIGKALTNFRMVTDGLTAPITFASGDRKGADGLKLLRADARAKQFRPITDFFLPAQ